MKICTFAGHANISDKEKIKLKLKKEIVNLIENENTTIFYNGGKGSFDWLCARTVNELRKNYPFIKSYWVLAYMLQEKNEHTKNLLQIFDGSIYPNLETVSPRLAILKRNEWAINNSDFLIAYVQNDWGGASKTLKYAMRKRNNIKIINIKEKK